MGSVNQNLRGIRIKIALFGTPKSGKYSFLQSMCKITSTQGNLQLFSDENGDVFSFVPIVRSVFSENISLQVKIMGARDKKGDGIVWQSIFKDVDGLLFLCRTKKDSVQEITEYLHRLNEYMTHFGPRDYSVPKAIFYNKYESDMKVEELNKLVNKGNLRYFSGDLSDILSFISAIRFLVKEGLKKHQSDYERMGGKKNIEEAFEIVEVFRPAGVQMAENNVIINLPEEKEASTNVEIKVPPPPPPEEEIKTEQGLKEEEIEELSEMVEEKLPRESTVKVKVPVLDFSHLSEKGELLSKMMGEIEQASQFFTLKISDLKGEFLSLTKLLEGVQPAFNNLMEENRSLSDKISTLKIENKKLSDKDKELQEQIKRNEELKRSVELSTRNIEELNAKILELEKTISEKDRIIHDKESLLAIKVTETDELKERLKALEMEKEKIGIDKRTIEDKLTVLQSKYSLLEEENKKLSEDASRLQEEILACKAESEELQTNLGMKERELEELKSAGKEEIESLKKEIDRLSLELKERAAPSNDEEVRRLSSEIVNLQIDIAQKEDRIKELEAELADKIKQIEELKASKPSRGAPTSETVNPSMLAKTIVANLKLKYWDDMLRSLKDGTFQKKYNPVFVELKKAYDSKVPETFENRDAIFQNELKGLLEELKKSV
ncbi:MAG: hypothetical protein ACPL7I_02330 [Myxococcota bacterium]